MTRFTQRARSEPVAITKDSLHVTAHGLVACTCKTVIIHSCDVATFRIDNASVSLHNSTHTADLFM